MILLDTKAGFYPGRRLQLVDDAVQNHYLMLTFEKPPVERTQGVPDMRAPFMVLEQIREHGRGFVRLIGFAFFGKPSQRRSGRSLFFDPRGGGIPCRRGP